MSSLLLSILQAWPSFPLTLVATISGQVMGCGKKCEAQFAARIFKISMSSFLLFAREYSNLKVVFSLFPRNPRAARVSADTGSGD
jgi:hypothetical protein